MSILNKLAGALGQKDEEANIELAKTIVKDNDKQAIKELVENLQHKNKKIQSDCIKTLYEVGEREPALIAEYYGSFLNLLENKNPRMTWGTMSALSAITLEKPKQIYEALPRILSSVDKSQSVIARDHTVYILTKLASIKTYADDAFDLLLEIIMKAPVNQLPMYAEYASTVVSNKNKSIFRDALISRLEDVGQYPAKQKRIEKVLKKLEKN